MPDTPETPETPEIVEEAQRRPEPLATYTSHPVQNFRIATYQFEKGVLKFEEGEEESLEGFEKLLESLPLIERQRIKKIDIEAAEALIEKLKAESGGPTQKIDSTVGERVNKPKPVGNLGRTLGGGN